MVERRKSKRKKKKTLTRIFEEIISSIPEVLSVEKGYPERGFIPKKMKWGGGQEDGTNVLLKFD